jgi:hypothetical protein
VRYTPRRQPLEQETDELARVLAGPTFPFFYLETLQAAPAKPQDGMIAKGAAGVLGGAAGVYCYYGAAWNFLG